MKNLFSYGTLQFTQVQQDTFGRTLEGSKDELEGYVVSDLKITDPKVIESSGTDLHPILEYTGNRTDRVEGTLFKVTDEELLRADAYEVEEYKRVELTFKSGEKGFVYLKND